MMLVRGAHAKLIGTANRQRIDQYFRSNPYADYKMAGHDLGMSHVVIGRHVRALRAEWLQQRKAERA